MNADRMQALLLLGLAGVVAYVAYRVTRVGAAAVETVADAYSPGGVAYEAGNTIQDWIIPGPDSLGTWLYGLFNDDPPLNTAPVARTPAESYDYNGSPYPVRHDPTNATATGGTRVWPYRS